jgi:hypothetical protein
MNTDATLEEFVEIVVLYAAHDLSGKIYVLLIFSETSFKC